jgi:PII-like signaling protein
VRKIQVTIYLNEADRIGEMPLHEYVVRRLLHFGIAGATVTNGLMGYGKHGKVHRKRLFGVSDDRPMVITAVDDEVRIRSILTDIKSVVPLALITLQEVEIP